METRPSKRTRRACALRAWSPRSIRDSRRRLIRPIARRDPAQLSKIVSAPVLESLADNLNGEYSAEVLANGRKSGCFPDPTAFTNILGKSAATLRLRYGTTSQYFRLTTHVTLGTTEFTLYSLLKRTDGGKVTPLLRSFGTP